MSRGFGSKLHAVFRFYVDGFRNMTWGKPLWILIILKLIILFAILRVFFFKPAMAGKTDEEKSEIVGKRLTGELNSYNNTKKNNYGLSFD